MKGGEPTLWGLAVGNGSDVCLHIMLAALKNSSIAKGKLESATKRVTVARRARRRTKSDGTLCSSYAGAGYRKLDEEVVALSSGRQALCVVGWGDKSRGG